MYDWSWAGISTIHRYHTTEKAKLKSRLTNSGGSALINESGGLILYPCTFFFFTVEWQWVCLNAHRGISGQTPYWEILVPRRGVNSSRFQPYNHSWMAGIKIVLTGSPPARAMMYAIFNDHKSPTDGELQCGRPAGRILHSSRPDISSDPLGSWPARRFDYSSASIFSNKLRCRSYAPRRWGITLN